MSEVYMVRQEGRAHVDSIWEDLWRASLRRDERNTNDMGRLHRGQGYTQQGD